MKRSQLLTWALVAAGVWAAGFVYNVYISGYPSWLRTMYARKVDLANEIDEPKIIIAGGSGAHYTINSEVMEEILGQPVMNFGTNGGIGLNVLLPSVIDAVKPGDTLVLIPEYPLLLDKDGLDDLSVTFGLMIGRPGLGGVAFKDLVQGTFMLGIPSLRAISKTGVDIVTEGRLDYYGDPLTQRGDATIELTRFGKWWPMGVGTPISDYALEEIEEFEQEVEARGGQLVLSLPWIYGKTDEKTMTNVQKTVDALSEVAPVLYDPENYNIQTDVSMFADTHYHLKVPARALRSQQLAEQLQTILPEMADAR